MVKKLFSVIILVLFLFSCSSSYDKTMVTTRSGYAVYSKLSEKEKWGAFILIDNYYSQQFLQMNTISNDNFINSIKRGNIVEIKKGVNVTILQKSLPSHFGMGYTVKIKYKGKKYIVFDTEIFNENQSNAIIHVICNSFK